MEDFKTVFYILVNLVPAVKCRILSQDIIINSNNNVRTRVRTLLCPNNEMLYHL